MSMFFDHVGWNKLLEDVGVKGRWMSYLELANGTLATRGVKVLVLPRALALSKAQRDAIEAWVAAGGTLIADVSTEASNPPVPCDPRYVSDRLLVIAVADGDLR